MASEFHDSESAAVAPPPSFGHNLRDPINQRPFVGSIDEHCNTNGQWPETDAEVAAIKSLTGRDFTHSIVVAAMCNQDIDHQTLCWLLSQIAIEYNGMVDFDMLNAPYSELSMVKCEWSSEDGNGWTVLGDAASCDLWLAHPQFRMVK